MSHRCFFKNICAEVCAKILQCRNALGVNIRIIVTASFFHNTIWFLVLQPFAYSFQSSPPSDRTCCLLHYNFVQTTFIGQQFHNTVRNVTLWQRFSLRFDLLHIHMHVCSVPTRFCITNKFDDNTSSYESLVYEVLHIFPCFFFFTRLQKNGNKFR